MHTTNIMHLRPPTTFSLSFPCNGLIPPLYHLRPFAMRLHLSSTPSNGMVSPWNRQLPFLYQRRRPPSCRLKCSHTTTGNIHPFLRLLFQSRESKNEVNRTT